MRVCIAIAMSSNPAEALERVAAAGKDAAPARPKILALCGAKSNNAVTKLQLENLHVTEDHYDIRYMHGSIEVEEGDANLAGLFRGPFYSWIDDSDAEAANESIVNSVRLVLKVAQAYGPFDGVYGFSNGGLIAALAANIAMDSKLRTAVEASPASTPEYMHAATLGSRRQMMTRASRHRSSQAGRGSVRSRRGLDKRRGSVRSRRSVRNMFSQRQRSVLWSAPLAALDVAPFRFVVCACAGVSWMHGLEDVTCSVLGGRAGEEEAAVQLSGKVAHVRSLHLIGMEDPLKTKSEELASRFVGAQVMYIPGGHSISRDERHDLELAACVKEICHFAQEEGTDDFSDQLAPKPSDYRPVNPVTSIAVDARIQACRVQLRGDLLPSGKHGGTILDCLRAQPKDKPFLFEARSAEGASTTYGAALAFVEGGEGDLRRLGVGPGEVVAYGAPPGGGAAAALAFLAFGAQTAAAPLAPGATEPEALDALDQFRAKHLVLFDGVDCPGVRDAFEKYAADGRGRLHAARILGPGAPGQFRFTSAQAADWGALPALRNPADGPCLLLRTSGTTARPKGVPLSQGALVDNGAIIAASMQLTDADVCYSVMPLFHIGGISASVLCTLASGGAVCCDGAPFDPARMVDALATSEPRPTWYSSVPTIHNATVAFLRERAGDDPRYAGYGVRDGAWKEGHSLRMIRSGAAALLPPDATALAAAYGGIPIYPTYSMSEQMPISQPPAGKGDTVTSKPGSVGVPVAASVAIVSRSHLRPQPYGQEGEIAISGATVMRNYLENPEADAKNYFFLTMPGDSKECTPADCRYFLTGDVGVLDSEGFLSLKGRAKELIKKGGEQVSPYEVEAELLDHPWVRIPICFSVPSKVYGEEVGCAIVLNEDAPKGVTNNEVIKSLRKWMKQRKFAPVKWPTKWWIGPDEELPKTKTKKYIRVGLAQKLGFDDEEDVAQAAGKESTKAKIDWGVITGFRFFLACYVMFMHIGSNESWGHFNNLRGWPWHVHCFYTLGGFSMASPMNPYIKKKFSYFLARIGNMYPMYSFAMLFGLVNLLMVCRPATFDPNFHWDGQPDDKSRGFFCEGTPATKTNWWASLATTIITYIFGLAITPIWPLNWWMGYYLWFSSMYYQCLAVFPAMYNWLFSKTRKRLGYLVKVMVFLQVLNALVMVAAWYSMKSAPSFNHYDSETGEPNPPLEYDNEYGSEPVVYNAVILSFYLFAPFWALYFVMGCVLAFIYDAHKPAERHSTYIWGYIADICTLIQIAIAVTIICQPVYNDPSAVRWFRPSDADYIGDASSVHRLWDNLAGRIMCPLTTLWIYAMATGEGYTAAFFRGDFIVNTLGPNSYNCFLFHQMIGQWYYAATRPGEFWNWWQYRKSFYWFSPGPCPVEWYEYFYVVGIVVAFSDFMDSVVMPGANDMIDWITVCIKGEPEEEDIDIGETLCGLIEKMTGIEPEMDSTLDEVGLASVGIPVIVGMLNSAFSTKKNPLSVSSADLVDTKTIEDIVAVVEAARARMEHDGV